MAITNDKMVAGFDPEILLISEGYVARPVSVDKNTISGLQPDEKGRYIIPYGTYLTGVGGSLLENPQQLAVAVVPTVTKASTAINTVLEELNLKVMLTRDDETSSSFNYVNMYDADGRIGVACSARAKYMMSFHVVQGFKICM